MIAVIFEVELSPENRGAYMEIASALKSTLANIDGFISVERFQSVTDPNKLVSLSFFETEQAVMEWRSTAEHRVAQAQGREKLFQSYRLRVAEVIRDYGMEAREETPPDSLRFHNG